MNIENCKEVLTYFCLPHTLSVRDDTKFARMGDGSLREQKGDKHICVSANGIEFSEKFPRGEAKAKRWDLSVPRGSDWYRYLMLHVVGEYAHRPFVYEGTQVVVIEHFEAIGAVSASFKLCEVATLEIEGLA